MDLATERALLADLRSYLVRYPGSAKGLGTLLAKHGFRLITEDEGEFLDWAEIREFAEMPVEGHA